MNLYLKFYSYIFVFYFLKLIGKGSEASVKNAGIGLPNNESSISENSVADLGTAELQGQTVAGKGSGVSTGERQQSKHESELSLEEDTVSWSNVSSVNDTDIDIDILSSLDDIRIFMNFTKPPLEIQRSFIHTGRSIKGVRNVHHECIQYDAGDELPVWCNSDVAVKLASCDASAAQEIAEKTGYTFRGQIGSLDCYYLFTSNVDGRGGRNSYESLSEQPDVIWSGVQRVKLRVKRGLQEEDEPLKSRRVPTTLRLPWGDPLYSKQWHLTGEGTADDDMRIQEAWKMGYSGANVVVTVVDDGIQRNHPDLKPNYDQNASTDITDRDHDPMPWRKDKHGTRCAGVIASKAGNDWCGVGVAYNSRIGGIKLLDTSFLTDQKEAAALSFNNSYIDIYSSSWGPSDRGTVFDGPGPMTGIALYNGATKGRKGKGNIFIFASGNGGKNGDSCSCDGYLTSIYTVGVAAITKNHSSPEYAEECPAIITTAYSGNRNKDAIVTTDINHKCTESHSGTSASTPIVAGIVALALEANGNLTWRDIQHLIVRSSNYKTLSGNSHDGSTDGKDKSIGETEKNKDGWRKNGAKRAVSHRYGFGLLDAAEFVSKSETWKNVPEQHSCAYEYGILPEDHLRGAHSSYLFGPFNQTYNLEVNDIKRCKKIRYLEHVQAIISIVAKQRGHLKITLTSPMGTNSVLLTPRRRDHSNLIINWPFLSVHYWEEDPRGVWILTLENANKKENRSEVVGTFNRWSLILYGTETPPEKDEGKACTSDCCSIMKLFSAFVLFYSIA